MGWVGRWAEKDTIPRRTQYLGRYYVLPMEESVPPNGPQMLVAKGKGKNGREKEGRRASERARNCQVRSSSPGKAR